MLATSQKYILMLILLGGVHMFSHSKYKFRSLFPVINDGIPMTGIKYVGMKVYWSNIKGFHDNVINYLLAYIYLSIFLQNTLTVLDIHKYSNSVNTIKAYIAIDLTISTFSICLSNGNLNRQHPFIKLP